VSEFSTGLDKFNGCDAAYRTATPQCRTQAAIELAGDLRLGAPGVADGVAVGMTNDAGLEEIWAAVVVGTGFDSTEALRFCQLRLSDRAPERLIPIDVVPRNDMGKIIREDVRKLLREATMSRLANLT
jgi:acyl-coenzyme A synthetase/AMP-(fatty) acid ligase